MWKAASLALILLAACGHESAPRPSESTAAAPTVATPPTTPASAGDAAAARAEWLRTVQAYAADPKSIPRLSDPAGKKRFEQLVAERAWVEIDGATFGREGLQLIAFYPAAKAFGNALTQIRAVDESVLFKLYMDDVQQALVRSGTEFMESQRRIEPNQQGREGGIRKVQIGMAMEASGLLIEHLFASAPVARRVVDRFSRPDAYTLYSTEGLQLILATIDARFDPKSVATIRATVAKVHAERIAASGQPDRIFEALTIWPSPGAHTVESKGGGFAVTVGPGALVWRSDSPRPGTEHLEWREGELLLEVYCIPGLTIDNVVATFTANGGKERSGPGPGRWLDAATSTDRDGAMRIIEIDGRACLAGIEAPKGTVAAARLDEILDSLRASH